MHIEVFMLHSKNKASQAFQNDQKELYDALRKNTKGRPSHPSYLQDPLQYVGNLAKRFLKMIFIGILALAVLLAGIGSGILYAYIRSTTPLPTEMLQSGTETSFVYDKNGEVISKLTGSMNIDRQYISLDSVRNTYIDDAFISIEDERFESHIGIDPKRIASAIVSAFANGGTPTHGGSTITQQVIKLISGNDEISAQRKIQEWYRAVILDEQLSKNDIMELYLNFVPFGNSYTGVFSASQGYFGKNPADLTLAESALLAGIPKAPSYYNLRTESGLKNAFRRQRIVLNKMYELGKITKAELDQARNEEIRIQDSKMLITGTMINSYFTEYAIQEAVEHLKAAGYEEVLARQYISNGGVHVYTSFDPQVQKQLDKTFNTLSLFQKNPALYEDEPEKPQAAMVVIDNATGNIAGMAGGFGEKTSNLIWNRAVNLTRQPGSSIKPLVVYGPALEAGVMTGATIIEDEEVFLNGPTKPWPTNYDMQYRGKVSFRNALKGSLNVPAVKILQTIGIATGKKYLKDVGIDWTQDPVTLAAAVGAPQTGVSPLLMAQAYATFANQGVFRKAASVTKITDKNGNILYEQVAEGVRAYSVENAYILTTMLQENLRGVTSAFNYAADASMVGTVENGAGESIETAGKTGTTDDNVDKWFAGYTPYYTAAVWYGFDNQIKKTSIPTVDHNNALAIWHDAMNGIHSNLSPKAFVQPEGVVTRLVHIESGLLVEEESNKAMLEYFVANSPLIPTEYHKEEGDTSSEAESTDGFSFDYWKRLFTDSSWINSGSSGSTPSSSTP